MALKRTNPNYIDKIKSINWLQFSIAVILCLCGITALFSAGQGWEPWAIKQLTGVLVFLPILLFIALIDLKQIYHSSYFLYFLGIVILLLTNLMGHQAMGAKRWVHLGSFNIQPAELVKLFVILCIAKIYHDVHKNHLNKLTTDLKVLLLAFIPALLIFIQPNLSTAVVIVLTVIIMSFVAGVHIFKYVIGIAIVLGSLPLLWLKMHKYQKSRVLNFLNPESDPLGAGYNVIQSKIAIGSGGIWGKGFMFGTQNQLNFLPEKQTDFIMTMIAEEFGFIGVLFIIISFLLLMLFCVKTALECRNQFGRLVVVGIASTLFIHFAMNIAMISGLIPVVGTPMPFLSYGRSNLMFCLFSIGIVLNIGVNKNINIKSF